MRVVEETCECEMTSKASECVSVTACIMSLLFGSKQAQSTAVQLMLFPLYNTMQYSGDGDRSAQYVHAG